MKKAANAAFSFGMPTAAARELLTSLGGWSKSKPIIVANARENDCKVATPAGWRAITVASGATESGKRFMSLAASEGANSTARAYAAGAAR